MALKRKSKKKNLDWKKKGKKGNPGPAKAALQVWTEKIKCN